MNKAMAVNTLLFIGLGFSLYWLFGFLSNYNVEDCFLLCCLTLETLHGLIHAGFIVVNGVFGLGSHV
ncbi:MAG: hypothetical protein ACI3YI_05210 [Bacteroidaceae bacterium]